MPRRKIPTKADLTQLQRLYKTDEKIAERLGATPQLVAYWRRKKNIPKYSFPKFSDKEVRELWERFGDDYRCGLELGLSKAAFYNWRRRYEIKDKPEFLKLEQLELNLGGPNGLRRRSHHGQLTIAQKILAERAGQDCVESGQEMDVEADVTVCDDRAIRVMEFFAAGGRRFVWNPNRIVIPLDHLSLPDLPYGGEAHKTIREFTRRQNIKYFYDLGEGISGQVAIEKGHILPGQLVFGTNPHIIACGCLGAFSQAVDYETMAAIWAEGKYRIKVPATVKITVNGKSLPQVMARDIVLFMAGKLDRSNLAGRAVEFYGTAVTQMSISERYVLSEQMQGLSVTAAVTPFDAATRRYLTRRTTMPYRPSLADRDARYESSFEFNIDQLTPQVACPHSIDTAVPAAQLEGQPIEHVIIGGTMGGRFDDLRVAADILKGKKVNRNVRLLVCPASRTIFLEALKKGLIRAFVDAGAIVLNPCTAPWRINHNGYLAAGENCLATVPDNSQGAMGSPEANIYLASAATAAATALKGFITDPSGYGK